MRIAALLAPLLLAACVGASAAPADGRLEGDESEAPPAYDLPEPMTFSAWPGPALRVFVLRPESAADDAPVVFVMHGVKRDADRYFNDWRPLAERHGFVIAVPEFSAADFPGAAYYNLGGVGAAPAGAASAFTAIEPLFDAVRARYGLRTERYALYGHSAGAQFAHRFAMFGHGARADRVIAANAGWYTFPGGGDWPYGPNGLPAGAFSAATALGAPLVVLAGEADIDPRHPSLRRTREAAAQGRTRFERAQRFYAAGVRLAAERGATLGWSCVTAPAVDHDDAKAAPFAVALIFAAPPTPGAPCAPATPR